MRWILRHFLFILPALALIVVLPQQGEARNLFDILFGRKKQEVPQPPVIQKKKPKKPPQTASTQPKQKPKVANAKRILVVGDFVANAIVDGLNQLYANNPNVAVINRTENLIGLVRLDKQDLSKNLVEMVQKEKPDVIIVSIGANDNQPMKLAKQTLDVKDNEWGNIYDQRIAALTSSLQQTKKAWLWVGQPAYKNPDLTQNIIILNALYKQAVEKTDGKFIDVWDGFVDDQGKFALSGYDVNGQTARLRTNDGINFTQAGKRKLAFYLDKPLDTILNLQNPLANNDLATDPKGPVLTMLPRDVDRVAPMNILDMARQNNGLLGDTTDPLVPKLDEKWVPKNGHSIGRADNFTLLK